MSLYLVMSTKSLFIKICINVFYNFYLQNKRNRKKSKHIPYNNAILTKFILN